MEFESVIGLEIHVQLNTKSKIFCNCANQFGSEANSQTCPVCLGMPGVLPVLNEEVLEKGIKAGLALNCNIAGYSKFDRKNYFYPDLPKAYQISQYDMPVCLNGFIDINTSMGPKRIGITRLHLEEDAGKSIHSDDKSRNISYVDLNRTGVPLAEIVSEPDMRTAEEAYEYLQKIKSIMKYIDVSDVNMEEGSLRCDVNISVREKGVEKFGEKVEIKNLNSFKAVKAAIDYEFNRQVELIEDGAKNQIVQETRLWNPDSMETTPMRSKEDAHDYRYFPDPDLPPIVIESSRVDELRAGLPELPDEKKERFIKEYSLPEYDASVLTSVRQLADYYEEVVKYGGDCKRSSNWIMSEVLAQLDDPENIDKFIVKAEDLAKLVSLICDDTISGKIGKTVFRDMLESGDKPENIIEKKGLKQVTDSSEIEGMIDKIIEQNPQSVEDFKSGKAKAMGFLVGQVMKESKGKANPQIVNEILTKKLNEL